MSELPTSSGNLSALIQVQTTRPSRNPSPERSIESANNRALTADDRKAIEAAESFEALLIHNMLKGMRKTTLSENTSNERAIYDDMLDEKLATTMIEAGGLGVARQIINQLQGNPHVHTAAPDSVVRNKNLPNKEPVNAYPADHSVSGLSSGQNRQGDERTDVPARASGNNSTINRLREIARGFLEKPDTVSSALQMEAAVAHSMQIDSAKSAAGLSTTDVMRLRMASELWGNEDQYDQVAKQQQFLQPLIPHAKRNAARLGTSHEAILAIAALETGWGQSMIKTAQGDNSFNLFGIKAIESDTQFTQNTTTEYINGRAEKIEARFRTYKNSSDAVDGFATFVLENPRYSNALKHAQDPERFLQELHKAGYATDPEYANKAISVMNQIRNHPLPL